VAKNRSDSTNGGNWSGWIQSLKRLGHEKQQGAADAPPRKEEMKRASLVPPLTSKDLWRYTTTREGKSLEKGAGCVVACEPLRLAMHLYRPATYCGPDIATQPALEKERISYLIFTGDARGATELFDRKRVVASTENLLRVGCPGDDASRGGAVCVMAFLFREE